MNHYVFRRGHIAVAPSTELDDFQFTCNPDWTHRYAHRFLRIEKLVYPWPWDALEFA